VSSKYGRGGGGDSQHPPKVSGHERPGISAAQPVGERARGPGDLRGVPQPEDFRLRFRLAEQLLETQRPPASTAASTAASSTLLAHQRRPFFSCVEVWPRAVVPEGRIGWRPAQALADRTPGSRGLGHLSGHAQTSPHAALGQPRCRFSGKKSGGQAGERDWDGQDQVVCSLPRDVRNGEVSPRLLGPLGIPQMSARVSSLRGVLELDQAHRLDPIRPQPGARAASMLDSRHSGSLCSIADGRGAQTR